jgi:hypothetical protein
LTLDNAEIPGYLESLDTESRAIKEELIKICWYMRGGITYNQAAALSPSEREIIGKLIKENLETTRKSGLPFF